LVGWFVYEMRVPAEQVRVTREPEEMSQMKKTVGIPDRIFRVVVAAGAVAGAGVLGFTSGWGIVLLVVAAVLLLTGASAYCPAYSVLHIDTLPHDRAGSEGHGVVGTHQPA